TGTGYLAGRGKSRAATRERPAEDGAGVFKKSRGLLCQAERVRFAAIKAEKAHYPVALMCRVLEVSRAGYYASRCRPESRRSTSDRQLAAKVQKVYEASRGNYGSPRVYVELREAGEPVGRHRVDRLMRQQGLRARKKRRFRVTT